MTLNPSAVTFSPRIIREAAALRQIDVAHGLGLSATTGKSTVAQLEARRDWLLSSIIAYLKACGASADLTVTVNGATIKFDLT